MHTLAIALLQSGKHILVNIIHSPAPSTLAASIIPEGILLIHLVSKNTAKGEKIPGNHIDQFVLVIPNQSQTRKFGTNVT